MSFPTTTASTTLLAASPNAEQAVETVTGFWKNETTQSWLVDKPIRIALILLFAVVAHWLLRRLITKLADNSIKNGRLKSQVRPRRKAAKQDTALAKTHEARRVSRLQTLASVGRSAAGIFVWVWAVLAILSEVGVNVAPLVASAGVVGVALGFGAQSLVKDFLSGIFMLLEDQSASATPSTWAMASSATWSPSPYASPRFATWTAPCGTSAMARSCK